MSNTLFFAKWEAFFPFGKILENIRPAIYRQIQDLTRDGNGGLKEND